MYEDRINRMRGAWVTTHNLSLKALSGKMDVEVTALAVCRQEFLERAAKAVARGQRPILRGWSC